MKTFKNLLLVLLFFSFFTGINGQDCKLFFPDQIGTMREMTSYDKKDKVTGMTIQEVLDVKEEPGGIILTVSTIIMDADENEVSNSKLDIECSKGVFKVDMSEYLGEMLNAYQSMEVEMEGDNLTFPSNLNVGDKLEDASMDIRIINNGIQIMQMNVRIFNREVLGKEDVTTDAGTFDSYMISYEIESKTKLISVKTSSIEWIAEDTGIIKSETYNKRGKLIGYTLLTAFEK